MIASVRTESLMIAKWPHDETYDFEKKLHDYKQKVIRPLFSSVLPVKVEMLLILCMNIFIVCLMRQQKSSQNLFLIIYAHF